MITFNRDLPELPILVEEGVAAFDPVTLRIATEAFAAQFTEGGVSLPPSVAGELPSSLAAMAEITVSDAGIRTVIDTGDIDWPTGYEPTAGYYPVYDGRAKMTLFFSDVTVKEIFETYVTQLDMDLRTGGRITAWFAELADPPEEILDALALTRHIRDLMCGWNDDEIFTGIVRGADLTVPILDLQYHSSIDDVAGFTMDGAPFRALINQRFQARLDENGMRVLAMTECEKGIPRDLPPYLPFGSRDPVLFWLTDADAPADLQSPFAVFYTTANAWRNEFPRVR